MKPRFFTFRDIIKRPKACDFHIHTTYTDGKSTIEEYVTQAIKLDIEEIAFTEHVRKESSWYSSFVENIELVRDLYKNKIRIYHGIETKVLNVDGDVDATEEMLDTAELVLGSVHRFPKTQLVHKPPNINCCDPQAFAENEFNLSLALIKNSAIDVLAHPGGMYIKKYKTAFPTTYLKELIGAANQYKTVIEINSSYQQDIVFDTVLFSQLNPFISLGSDAHSMEELGQIHKFMSDMEWHNG